MSHPGQLLAPLITAPQLHQAGRSRRRSFLARFFGTWLLIIFLVGVFIVATGQADLDFTTTWGPLIASGAILTVFLSITSIAIAVVFALLGALGRLSRNPYLNGIASFYVSFVRGTPLLVQLYVVFFALPAVGLIIPAIPSAIFALSFNYGAYMTEVFRAGIQAVPRGQREAAQALGMPERLVMRRIVLPQATRIVIPAIGNDFVAMIKDTSLVSTLGVQELLWYGQTVGRSHQHIIQALLIAAMFYWGLTILFSFLQERLERRMARGDR
jgi:polar amino acid transport system permease protein